MVDNPNRVVWSPIVPDETLPRRDRIYRGVDASRTRRRRLFGPWRRTRVTSRLVRRRRGGRCLRLLCGCWMGPRGIGAELWVVIIVKIGKTSYRIELTLVDHPG